MVCVGGWGEETVWVLEGRGGGREQNGGREIA